MTCHAELCANWTGHGCACEVFGLVDMRLDDEYRYEAWYGDAVADAVEELGDS